MSKMVFTQSAVSLVSVSLGYRSILMEMSFDYKARNLNGELITGKIEADTRQAAIEILRARDLFVVNIWRPYRKIKLQLPIGRVKVKEMAIFCRQFAIMNDTGIPVLQSLHILREQTTDRLLQKIISEAIVAVESGKSLSESFMSNADSLPPVMINMLIGAETSGSLDLTLERLADNFEKENQIREKVKSALAYPALVTAVSLLAVFIMLIYVVPVFVDVFDQMGATLPAVTRLLLAMSGIVRQHSLLIVALLLLIFLAVKNIHKVKFLQAPVDMFLFRIPGVGTIIKGVIISRFARTLSMLLHSGVPLLSALSIVENVVDNSRVAAELSGVRRQVEVGEKIAPALKNSKVFPPMVTGMIAVGEETGQLETVLEKLGAYYDQNIESVINRLSSLLEPGLICLVGLMVGFVALSIYLPLFQLSGSM
jgi:type IV pilus assembly protein PilC